jgi:putative endonuclease
MSGQRASSLAFIEVKARSAEAGPDSPLMPRQRRRIVRGAEAFLAARPSLAALDVRFDLMLVGRGTLPRHLRAVFRADD